METIALNRLNILCAPTGTGLTNEQSLTLLAELGQMGYRVTNPGKLAAVSPLLMKKRELTMNTLAKKRGGNVEYVPLFKNFGDETPDDRSYFMKRLIGFIGNKLNNFEDGIRLENGVKVPEWLFNVYDFGADPITQFQSKELFEIGAKEEATKLSDSHTEWIDLELLDEEETMQRLKAYLLGLLYAKSSIKEALHQDVYSMLDYFGYEFIESDRIIFKETKSLLLNYFWAKETYSAIVELATSGTDLLRMFAAITGSDISLADKIKFPKMKRPARKAVLATLEKSPSLAEDLVKYKGLWLELGRYLHPGEYAKAYPKTAAAFDALRNGKIETYNAKTEKLIVQNELQALLAHLSSRPGVFARKLHELLRKFPKEKAAVLLAFEEKIGEVQLKNLLVMKQYFATINAQEHRTVINRKGKVKVIENNAKEAFALLEVKQVVAALEKAIVAKLSEKEAWTDQKVWVDPKLKDFTVPLQQRKASDGMITLERGSRIDVDFDKVLRLFVYWKDAEVRTDLDLSVMQFDAALNYIGHVSYTNLKTDGIVHSGDIQSAPHGAAEFVDISLQMLAKEVKYLAVEVYKYSGSNFSEIQCHTGWMMRQQTSADMKSFDIKTVANKFDMNGNGAYAIPLIVDLEAKQIILTDLYVSGKTYHNNVEGAHSDVSLICSQIKDFVHTKPNLYELSQYHAIARKAVLVNEKEEADITFGQMACTYNATDVETILSELI